MTVLSAPLQKLALHSGSLRAEILPQIGGALARLDWVADAALPSPQLPVLPVLRGLDDGDVAPGALPRPNQLACFPLVPWSNRMAGGFAFGGSAYAIAPNREGEPCPMHGDGWLLPWEVLEHSACRAVLALERSAGAVFTYRATLDYALDDGGLSIVLDVCNTGEAALPFGLGLHPWMPRSSGVTVQLQARSVWLAGADKLPVEEAAIPGTWSFAHPAALPESLIDNVFAGWDGRAKIHWQETGLALAMESDCRYCIVYAPPGKDFFCIEPVDHRIDAHNGEGGPERHGLTVLAPGASLRRHFRFSVSRTPPGA